MKYVANIHEFDSDYHHSYGRDIKVEVNSWEEAEAYCKENSSRPFRYTINFLKCSETGKVYHKKGDFNVL